MINVSSRFLLCASLRQSIVGDLREVTAHNIISGVLQGSISGSILFILLIEELVRQIQSMPQGAQDVAFTVDYGCKRKGEDEIEPTATKKMAQGIGTLEAQLKELQTQLYMCPTNHGNGT